jgi:hypothetical protein
MRDYLFDCVNDPLLRVICLVNCVFCTKMHIFTALNLLTN